MGAQPLRRSMCFILESFSSQSVQSSTGPTVADRAPEYARWIPHSSDPRAKSHRTTRQASPAANQNLAACIPIAMTDDEARWIARARAGDATAFRHLVDANAGALFRVCARITGDRATAEDAVEEALF